MNRRDLLKLSSIFLTGTTSGLPLASSSSMLSHKGRLLDAHIVIIGGGVGGCAAALAAARAGYKVIMTEETDWIGGQLTQQAVPPDEHPWIEQFGATQSYRDFRTAVRRHYQTWYPLKGQYYSDPKLNPGACGVSYLCHEPRVAHQVLAAMLSPYLAQGKLQLHLNTVPVSAVVQQDKIVSINVKHSLSGNETELRGLYFLDATELGDLLPLSGAEYVTGAESKEQTGEPHAPDEPAPHNMQAMTWCFAIDYEEGADHTIPKPDNYEKWQQYVPRIDPPWPGKLFSLTYSNPITLEPRTLSFDPRPGVETEFFNLWSYRRLLAPSLFQDGTFQTGISLINWPQNDYLEGNILEVTEEEKKKHMKGAMDVSLSLLYWLQTEAPRQDGKAGWPGLRLRADVSDTDHGLAKRPYIREARRIKALFTVAEQHVGLEARMAETQLPVNEVTAASFPDSLGVGSYRIDLHPSTGGDNYIDISSLPFEIPLGALIPQRLENLLPACKNLGVTHITNGCYRLHPVEWNIGESAALTAVHALNRELTLHQIHASSKHTEDLQKLVTQHGVEIRWPRALQTPR